MSETIPYRNSIFSKLTLGLILVPVAVFTIITVLSAVRTQNTLRQEITNQINDDVANLSENYIDSGVESVASAIQQRLALSPLNRAGAHYKLTTQGGRTLAGDLSLDRNNDVNITQAIEVKDTEYGTLLTRSTVFKDGEILTVARETKAQSLALIASLWDFLIGVSAIVIMSFILVYFSVSRLRTRLGKMNSIFRRVGEGETEARLPLGNERDELARLSNHINAMIARTGRLLTLRKRVTDQVAHEMRSPLTRLDASLTRVEKQVGSSEEIEHAREELKHCVNLLDGLLDISSLDAQEGDKRGFEDINFTDLIRSIVELFEPVAEDASKPINVELSLDIRVSACPSQIGRLVSNLLDNAIKYADENTAINVKLIREGQKAIFSVANSGKPISKETSRDIFTPFFRNPDMSEKKGYGLGLALSRAIAKRHDGYLELEPTPKQILFKLTLPCL